MQTTNTRERGAQRASRTPEAPRAQAPRPAPAQTDWVWPGMTRAQLRDMIIEQIG